MLMAMNKLPGGSAKQRCLSLWGRLQEWCTEQKVEERLQNMVLTMLKQPGKFPKLRSSAAQCRALVPFGLKLSRDLLDASDGMESTARHAMNHLSQCYVSLSDSSIFFADALREHSTKFALLYCALETTATNDWSWRVKPKLHMFLELCSEGSRPATFWTYRDEDFGGSVSRLSRRRGGPLRAKAFSSNLLQRFKCAQPVLRMLDWLAFFAAVMKRFTGSLV